MMNTTQQLRSSIWLALILIIGVSLLIAGCGSLTHPSFASSAPPTPVPATLTPVIPAPTLDPSDPLRYRKQRLAEMREQLQNPHLAPAVRAALERNIAIIEGDIRRVETARANPPDPALLNRPTRTPAPTRRPPPTGILERFSDPPTYPNDVTFTSAWQDQIDGEWIEVYAGVRASDSAQGFVYVDAGESRGEYPTPARVGAVTITSYEGTVLTLTSADGTTFQFDVATGTFVSE